MGTSPDADNLYMSPGRWRDLIDPDGSPGNPFVHRGGDLIPAATINLPARPIEVLEEEVDAALPVARPRTRSRLQRQEASLPTRQWTVEEPAPAGAVELGLRIGSRQPVYLSPDARSKSMVAVGITGSGKSTLFEYLAWQDMAAGDGLIFLDPHGTTVERLAGMVPDGREADTIFWDPSDRSRPFGINPFHCPDKDRLDSRASAFISTLGSLREFREVFASAPRMIDVLRHLSVAFVVNDSAVAHLGNAPRFLTDAPFRRRFYPALTEEYPQVRAYWEDFDRLSQTGQREITASSLNKLRRLQLDRIMAGIFSQPLPSLNFQQLLSTSDSAPIILVNLNRAKLGEDNAAFIGAFIVAEILEAALLRGPFLEGQLRRFHVFADEFQLYMSTSFPRLIAEARKFGVDVAVAHQHRSQLPDRETLGATQSVGTLVVFRVNGDDGSQLATSFDATPPITSPVGGRPRYGPTPKALEHLASHGHASYTTTQASSRLRVQLTELQRKAHDSNHVTDRYTLEHLGRIPVDDALTAIELEINSILYDAMQPLDDYSQFAWLERTRFYVAWRLLPYLRELYSRLLNNGATYAEPFDIIMMRYLDFLRFEADLSTEQHWLSLEEVAALDTEAEPHSTFGDRRAFLRPHWGISWGKAQDWFDLTRVICELVANLALDLRESPCWVATGQFDPDSSNQRLYSDMQAEVANRLVNQPAFQAHAKLASGESLQFTTVDFRPEIDAALADRIRDRSRREFGRPPLGVVRQEATDDVAPNAPTTDPIPFDTLKGDDTTGDDDQSLRQESWETGPIDFD